MPEMSLYEIQIAMTGGLFLVGLIILAVGVIVLIRRSAGREVRSLAVQTARLAQKGFAEEVAGLVGNATALLNATNDLMRTTAGVGIFLTLLGVGLMVGASYIVLRIP